MGTAYQDIQLSWLRAFLAVQATGSFTAAARRVHRAQSRVSAQVAQLEHHLGHDALADGQAQPVIASLPAGLDTQLGTAFEGGVGFSGGQWQRLALARAFMRDRPLLMLIDEPTPHWIPRQSTRSMSNTPHSPL